MIGEELGLLIDGATNYAIYMLDTDGLVTIWNRGAERIKGWSEAEIIGRHFAVFYPPEDVASGKPAADLARAHKDGPNHVALLADRGRRNVRRNAVGDVRRCPLDDRNGRGVGAVLEGKVGR